MYIYGDPQNIYMFSHILMRFWGSLLMYISGKVYMFSHDFEGPY